jgi:preprotein translocase subunit SecF
MSEEYEVHGAHDHAVEHAAHADSLGRWVAMFTAILATIGALISYQNGNAESRGLELKNEAILKKSAASDQWAYYQAKGIKEIVVANAMPATDADRARLSAEAARYAKEKKDIEAAARKLDEESKKNDEASERAVAPHHRLAQALALVQVAIAMAALTVLTRQRWMLGFSGFCALIGIAFWVMAWH